MTMIMNVIELPSFMITMNDNNDNKLMMIEIFHVSTLYTLQSWVQDYFYIVV
jgi:hypothetical protein